MSRSHRLNYLRKRMDKCQNSQAPTDRQRHTLRDALHTLGSLTNPFMDTNTASQLWSILRSRLCPIHGDTATSQWLGLLEAIGQRDSRRMAGAAQTIIKSGMSLTVEQQSTLTECIAIDGILSGQPGIARSILRSQAPILYRRAPPPLRHRLIFALAAKK